jgi:hypothetical protein
MPKVSRFDDGRSISEHMLEKFLKGIRKLESGCWVCDTAFPLSNGYCEIKFDRKSKGLFRKRVHIISYEHFVGIVPEGIKVCHECDNRPCCNPDHLFIGTQAENLADMAAKDRSCFGVKNHNAVLTEADVLEIYRLHANGSIQREIGDRYGITQTAVGLIVNGKRWVRLYKKQHGTSAAV